jgi:hypothetical protein
MKIIIISNDDGRYCEVEVCKRYGYWWKKSREICRKLNIEDFNSGVDYFREIPFKLGKCMSQKHLSRWNKKLKIKEKW